MTAGSHDRTTDTESTDLSDTPRPAHEDAGTNQLASSVHTRWVWRSRSILSCTSHRTRRYPPGHHDSAGAHGDQWTNMIQPFSVLPAPVIAGLQLRGHRVLHDDDAAGPGVALLEKKLIRSL